MSMFHAEDEVTVCSYHLNHPVQLIWTFAFNYKEFWCPGCGATYGMMGAGTDVKWTWKIHEEYLEYVKKSKRFLNANSILTCAYFRHKGKDMKPSEMPPSMRAYYEAVSKNWIYKYKD